MPIQVTIPTDVRKASITELARALRDIFCQSEVPEDFERVLEIIEEIERKAAVFESRGKVMQ